MSVILEKRKDGIALFIDGNLQFDSRDEALYHESLVLPALCAAKSPKRVLICGGGDGLALREVLRFPGIKHVDLVDLSDEVLEIAKTQLAEFNGDALKDRRVKIHIADATTFTSKKLYDVIICDFTFPRTAEEAVVVSREWYEKVKTLLAPTGIVAINGVSPQATPTAFACLVATVRAAGLNALPYRVCIPSFRDLGYGAWGFVLAGHTRLTQAVLAVEDCPVETRQADLSKLWRGAHFNRSERLAFRNAPVSTNADPIIVNLLLNPNHVPEDADAPPSLDGLIAAIQIHHPYHTKGMVETLAQQVVGSLRNIDLKRLVDELWQRAKSLPEKLQVELEKLRTFLHDRVFNVDSWSHWSASLFAALVIVLTVANAMSPDNAFAKGSFGVGHSSFSRGGAFGGGAGSGGHISSTSISEHGFSGGSYHSGPVDVYGHSYIHVYTPFYYYDHSYYGGYYGNSYRGNSGPNHQAVEHKPIFVADDDMVVMDNGDVILTVSPEHYILVSDGQMTLMGNKEKEAILPLYPDPAAFQRIQTEIDNQHATVTDGVKIRRDWLSWTGWTSAMMSTTKDDQSEYDNMRDLQTKLGKATQRLGKPMAAANTPPTHPEGVELFLGCHLLPDNTITIAGPDGKELRVDGSTVTDSNGQKKPLSPALKAALYAIMKKLYDEDKKDIASYTSEMQSLVNDETSTTKDLNDYQTIANQNPSEPDYEVDYGTDTVSVQTAIQKTQADLAQTKADKDQLTADNQKQVLEIQRFEEAMPKFK